eukprot:m.359147 g.359147  ORF g.359147 m.359147 type:complete len:86 (-) comp18438_c0_seq1:315-572(-)
MVEATLIEKKLREGLQATHVEVVDTSSGCGASYEVIIVSEAFAGMKLLQKHRAVNECLAEEIKQLHAFSQKAYTPEQWSKLQGSA